MKQYNLTLDDVKRFYSNIEVDSGQCWNWTGSLTSLKCKNGKKYPQFNIGRCNAKIVARRLAYYLAFSQYPESRLRDMCHNDLCVNPIHMIDSAYPQEIVYKTGNPFNSKPTDEKLVAEVWTLKKLGKSILDISIQLNLSYLRVSTILKMTKLCNQGKLSKYKKVSS